MVITRRNWSYFAQHKVSSQPLPTGTSTGTDYPQPGDIILFFVWVDNLTASTPIMTSNNWGTKATTLWIRNQSDSVATAGGGGILNVECARVNQPFGLGDGGGSAAVGPGSVTAKVAMSIALTGADPGTLPGETGPSTASTLYQPGAGSGQVGIAFYGAANTPTVPVLSGGNAVTAVSGGTTGGSAATNMAGLVKYATAGQNYGGTGAMQAYYSVLFNPYPDVAVTQAAYRFYDDGTEAGSTPLTAQDTPLTVSLA